MIGAEEGTGVIARHAEAGLREVVGAEAEEFSGLRNLVSSQCAPRNLDHRADRVGNLDFLFSHNGGGDLVHEGGLQIEFLLEAHEWDHDLGLGFVAGLGGVSRRFEHGAGLHGGDLGIFDPETTAAEAQHGVELMQLVNALHDFLHGNIQFPREIHLRLLGVREEFVERRVEKADRSWEAFECFEDAEEIFALIRQ